jgi:ornithine carbamoyltransferase
LRTRHSCEVAVVQLGGHPLTFFGQEVSPDIREPMSDIARVLDLLTIRQRFGSFDGRAICWIGDDNNTIRSLARGAAELDYLRRLGGTVEAGDDPNEAAKGADVVATDVWTSMGFENESPARSQVTAR